LVYLCPLSEHIGFQIPTVKDVTGGLLDCAFNFSEVGFVQSNGSSGLRGLRGGLAGGLDNKFGLVFTRAYDVADLGVGESGVLESIQGSDVSLLGTEFDLSCAFGLSISLFQEAVVALDDFPNQLIRYGNHFDCLYYIE